MFFLGLFLLRKKRALHTPPRQTLILSKTESAIRQAKKQQQPVAQVHETVDSRKNKRHPDDFLGYNNPL